VNNMTLVMYYPTLNLSLKRTKRKSESEPLFALCSLRTNFDIAVTSLAYATPKGSAKSSNEGSIESDRQQNLYSLYVTLWLLLLLLLLLP